MGRVRFSSNRPAVEAAIEAAAKERVKEAGGMVIAEVERVMREPKHGRVYPHPDGGTYTASAPGQAPAVVTENLLGSVEMREYETRDEIGCRVGTDVEYGLFLELGTQHVRPRPWLLRAAVNKMRDIERMFTNEWFRLVVR